MKVVIAGSRSITDIRYVEEAMVKCGWEPITIGWGGAAGVDTLAARWADARHIPTLLFRANWEKYDKAAGPIRNRAMAQWADAVVCVHDGRSRGTENMVWETLLAKKLLFRHTISPCERCRERIPDYGTPTCNLCKRRLNP